MTTMVAVAERHAEHTDGLDGYAVYVTVDGIGAEVMDKPFVGRDPLPLALSQILSHYV